MGLLLPEPPTAVLVDGQPFGAVGWDGGHPDPANDREGGPDEATAEAAAATDPKEVEGHIGLTGPGCPSG